MSGHFVVVSAALAPRNDTDHTPICYAAKYSLTHTVMHTRLTVHITPSISVYKGVMTLKSKSPSLRLFFQTGRWWMMVSIFQVTVSRSGGPVMASHQVLSTWTHPTEKLH